MARVKTEQWPILEGVRSHLQGKLGLDERQAVHSLDPKFVTMPVGGDFWIAVCPGPGQIDDGLFEGGGREQTTDWFQVAIAAYSRIHLDETGHDRYLLGEATRGVVHLRKNLLDALAGEDLTIGGDQYGRQLWQPTGYYYGVIHPVAADGRVDDSIHIGTVVQHFQQGFDWDLG